MPPFWKIPSKEQSYSDIQSKELGKMIFTTKLEWFGKNLMP
jgi:hypothetical protein